MVNLPKRYPFLLTLLALTFLAALTFHLAESVEKDDLTEAHPPRSKPYSAPLPPPVFRAQVLGVLDGDTIHVQHGKRHWRIRLFGMDCPESTGEFGANQPFGREATAFTRKLVEGKEVTIQQVDGLDKHGRIVGKVILESGKVLDQELVRVGLAWWSHTWSPEEKILDTLQTEARRKKLGLWSDPNSIHPAAFRARIEVERSKALNQSGN